MSNPFASNTIKFSPLIALGTTMVIAAVSLPAFGNSEYEESVISTITDITISDIDSSLKSLDSLVEKYPNSKIGQLILAELLSARAGSRNIGDRFKSNEFQLQGLKDEIRYRWKNSAKDSADTSGLLPSNLVQLSPSQQHAIVVDASQARLFIYKNLGHTNVLVDSYYVTVGKLGMGKTRKGDLRTPVGVYFVTSYLPGETLPARYGPGAFPINYPNEYDKIKNRTGYGIWIHGTEPENYNRIPLASDGCVSLSNDEFLAIEKYIKTDGTTPVIIAENFDWVDPTILRNEKSKFSALLYQWKEDLENLDNAEYSSHYAANSLRSQESGIDSWTDHNRHLRKSEEILQFNIRNLSIISYPGNQKIVVMSFDQEYASIDYYSSTPKKLYWQKEDDDSWKIIYEG